MNSQSVSLTLDSECFGFGFEYINIDEFRMIKFSCASTIDLESWKNDIRFEKIEVKQKYQRTSCTKKLYFKN